MRTTTSKWLTNSSTSVNAFPWIPPQKTRNQTQNRTVLASVRQSKNKDIPIILERQFYDQCILLVVEYGAETRNLTEKLMLKTRSMQRAYERIILGITWRDRQTAL